MRENRALIFGLLPVIFIQSILHFEALLLQKIYIGSLAPTAVVSTFINLGLKCVPFFGWILLFVIITARLLKQNSRRVKAMPNLLMDCLVLLFAELAIIITLATMAKMNEIPLPITNAKSVKSE